MADAHPVGFLWVMEAKERGARVIHVDPRFTRTSAVVDTHVRIRVGSDIVFLGGIVNYVLQNELDFREYVLAYPNAATIVGEGYLDTEDLDGLFSGFDPESRTYDTDTWQYAGMEAVASAGAPPKGEQAGHAGGSKLLKGGEPPEEDPTLQHPRCVFQVLKRHFARYSPEMVAEACGCSAEDFLYVAEALCDASGRERTGAFCYAVGWTQHTVGVQVIRTAAIVQLLLGNIGRPGGGILALRGHANIQGSTDVPTLYDILPSYIPMPHPVSAESLDEFVELTGPKTGVWGSLDAYMTSLLKAWWGEHATAENDFCFRYLPTIDADHSVYPMIVRMLEGKTKGYFLIGQNPVVGNANAGLHVS